jgi:4-amino-4-deoxy-L-arabinose transferase-like glycosyltransferase
MIRSESDGRARPATGIYLGRLRWLRSPWCTTVRKTYYYAAADRSMSMSWHDFIFGAFDPAGTITVDKLPGALWLQALSVRAFGMHTWATILPQVIEGILAVLCSTGR